ncbi:ligninase h2 precursor [Colletotrichum incanum]|nr:ligninase h2 precursor [Colletotrichum incanum]
MRVSLLTAALVATPVLAYPGMKNTFAEIQSRQGKPNNGGKSTELLGDLVDLDDSKLTSVGKTDTPECAADTCCIWKYIADDLETSFRGESGRCTDFARAAIRLGFHDAGGWSKGTGQLGGADGSIILAPEEIERDENGGLEEIVEQTKTWFSKYQQYGISMADLIQFSANVATVVCPMGPRVRTFVGRKDSSVPAPHDLLPAVTGSADYLIELFGNKTISSYGLISLIGAHTTSQQRYVDPERAGDPQDSTPGVWDVKFYSETIGNAPARVFKFASDIVLSKDSRTSAQFKAFAGPGGQSAWNEGYAREYIRLSLLGVYNINDLSECTKALPVRWAGIGFNAADQGNVDQWLTTKGPVPKIPDQLREGHPIGPPPRPAGPGGSKGNTPAVPTYNTPAVPSKDDAPKGNTPAVPPKGIFPSVPKYNTPATPPKSDAPKGNTPAVPNGNNPSAPPKGNSPAVPNGKTSSGSQGSQSGYGY